MNVTKKFFLISGISVLLIFLGSYFIFWQDGRKEQDQIREQTQSLYNEQRNILLQNIEKGTSDSQEFREQYQRFGADVAIQPYLYAFHYEVLFGERVDGRSVSASVQQQFDDAMDTQARTSFQKDKWYQLSFEEVQQLLEDETNRDLLRKMFQ